VKENFPEFKKCLAMMRKRDPQTQEDGFHALLPHASEHVEALISEFERERNHGLRCWFLELIGEAKAPEAFPLLAEQLGSDDERFRYWAIRGLKLLDTKQARALLREARSYTLATPEETEAFQRDLEQILRQNT
jgi:HEAT repeat protein